MASPDPVGTPEQVAPPLISTPEKTSPELSAPAGWQKKIGSSKKGSYPGRRDVHFIAPDGEEIKTKRMLDKYLKNHPGGPAASEFDWSTGETPPSRRSLRLSSKPRPSLDSPQGGSAEKRRKKKVEEEPTHEEETEEKEEPPAEVPPPIDEKKDEVMEDVETTEVKAVEEVPVAPLNGQEAKTDAVKEVETQHTDENVAESSQLDSGKKEETPAEVNAATDEGKEDKEATIEEKVMHENSAAVPEEASGEPKESSDKISNVFQHCPEAPNSSRQVDVST